MALLGACICPSGVDSDRNPGEQFCDTAVTALKALGALRVRRQQAREALRRLVDVVGANEPRLIGFNVYLDEEGATASVAQIHPTPIRWSST